MEGGDDPTPLCPLIVRVGSGQVGERRERSKDIYYLCLAMDSSPICSDSDFSGSVTATNLGIFPTQSLVMIES